MVTTVTPDKTLDLKGMNCPLVLANTKMALKEMEPGQILEVITTDSCTEFDLPSWAEKTGKELVRTSKEENIIKFYIKKI